MNSYPYDKIFINGREVTIRSIISGQVDPRSDFEINTFSFIAEWFSGNTHFNQNTSGSTGAPKSITITRKQMMASASLTISALHLNPGDVSLLCLSPEYIAGKMMLVRSFVGGMKIVAVTPSSNPLKQLPEIRSIDFAAMVPSQIYEIVRSENTALLNRIKVVIIGGAAIDRLTQQKLQLHNCKFYSTYGMTETVSHVALRSLNGKNASESYVTLPGIDIAVDERSCLVINWEQLDEKVITNDIVEIEGKNSFRWIGRWDNIINTGGFKVIPEKVESSVEKIFGDLNLNNAFFVGSRTDDKLGYKVVLFIEGEMRLDTIETLKARLLNASSKMEMPKEICLLKRFVLTENGKINRKASANLT